MSVDMGGKGDGILLTCFVLNFLCLRIWVFLVLVILALCLRGDACQFMQNVCEVLVLIPL